MEKPVLEIEGDTPCEGRVILEGLQDSAPMISPKTVQLETLVQEFKIGDYPHLGGVGLLPVKGVYPIMGFLLL